MPDKTIRAAILGTGLSLTAFHHPLLKALPELFTVHSVLERSGKETCRSIVGANVKIVTTYEDVIGDADVDLVVVSTPNRTHFEYVKRALEAGKHVMCEKPLTPTSQEAEELFKIAKANNRILGVYQNRRWDGDFLTIQKLIKDGTLGPIMDLTSCFDRYKPTEPSADLWKERGGEYNDALYNLGSHMIDQAIVLFGKPTRIFCRSWPQRGVEGLDEAYSMDLEYPPQPGSPSPLIVTTRASLFSPISPALRFQVRGMHGAYVKYGLDPQEAFLRAGGKARTEGSTDEPAELAGTVWKAKEVGKANVDKSTLQTVPGDYPAIYENLAEAINKGDQSVFKITAEQAALNIRIIEAGFQSSKEGRYIDI